MAVFDPVSNFGYGTVSVPPSPALSGLTLTLQAGEGALFPDAAVDGDFNVTAYPPDTGPLLSNAEILRVSDNSSDVFTFARGQEGTIAKAIAAGWQIAFAPTAKTMQDIFDAINAIAPGAGDVVGPASSVDNRPALFDGISGKLLKQASAALGTAAFAATGDFDAAGAAAAAQSAAIAAAASDATTKANAAQAAAEATAANANNLTSGTVPAARMPALTGDVTTSAGAVATTIANDAVTYAKMQNVSAASKLLGRGDSGSGDVQEITLGSGLTMTGTTLSSSGGSASDRLSILTAAEISITTTATATIGRMHVCSGTTSNYAVTLPAVSGNTGKFIGFRMAPGLTKFVTIDGDGTEEIDGALSRVMWANETCELFCDGSAWTKVAGKSIPFFVEVTRSTTLTTTNGAFIKISLPNVVSDVAGLWDTGNDWITMPRDSTYAFDAKYRVADNAPLISQHLGINSSAADIASGVWANTWSGAAGTNRNGIANRRVVDLSAGDQYFIFFYLESSAPNIIAASFVMTENITW